MKLILIFCFFVAGNVNANYESELQTWRADQETKLKSESSWLAVVGLHWLKNGKNTIGSSKTASVRLPASAPGSLGVLSLDKRSVKIEFKNVDGVLVDDKPAALKTVYELRTDKAESPTFVKVNTITFFVIDRKNGVGVRVKDSNSQARKEFKGRHWFKPDTKFVVKARWTALNEPKKISVPDIIGNVNDEESPGFAEFELDGKTISLFPIREGENLFFVFKDLTSEKETYGAARFLYSELPLDGIVVLDFNKAVNPPCAFTRYATCPLPPKENIIPVAIRAGELKTH